LHEHVPETACFGRNVNRQMERLSLYIFYHNYLKPHRTKLKHLSHAIVAGYKAGEIYKELGCIWKDRSLLSLTNLTECTADTWLRIRQTPLSDGNDYLPKYACA
jgi:hypothetical protein